MISTFPETAADIMHRQVVTIAPEDTLKTVIEVLAENHVSGVPVLDAHDRCVGVVSASDILEIEQDSGLTNDDNDGYRNRYFNPVSDRWEVMGLSSISNDDVLNTPVSEVMNRDLICVKPEDSIAVVAEELLEKQVHRILVMNDDFHLFGIITTSDFVRLVRDM